MKQERDKPFLGPWRIRALKQEDQKQFGLVAPAFIRFDPDWHGEFRLGAILGSLDCRFQGSRYLTVEFSWVGLDDGQPASGRGWCGMDGSLLRGSIFLHGGDEWLFEALRAPRGRRHSRPRAPSGRRLRLV